MTLSRRQVAKYAAEQLAGGTSYQKIARLLAAYTIETKSIRNISFLLRDIDKILNDEYGHLSISVTAAHSLGEDIKKQIISLVGSPKTHEIDVTIDPSILGGLIIQTPSKLIDVSVKQSIKNLKAIASN